MTVSVAVWSRVLIHEVTTTYIYANLSGDGNPSASVTWPRSTGPLASSSTSGELGRQYSFMSSLMLCSKVGAPSLVLSFNSFFAESTPQPLTKFGTPTGLKRQPMAMSTISNTHSTTPWVRVSTQIITKNSLPPLIIVMEMLGGSRRIRVVSLQVRIIEIDTIRRGNEGRMQLDEQGVWETKGLDHLKLFKTFPLFSSPIIRSLCLLTTRRAE